MQKLIGIDTGGTYTDAVLFDETVGVLAKAKALTTRADLAVGIGSVVDGVLREGGVRAEDIGMVSVSTTLATNTIVEGRGGRACLVMIGFSAQDVSRAGLREALRPDDAVVLLPGGHDVFGEELLPLDLGPLDLRLDQHAGAVTGFAVAGHFSVANPAHEDAVRRHIEARGTAPVTCSHDLSARLNGPKRALTSLLNARLIGIIHHLIDATEGLLAARGIAAPLMIVKGDGSLLSVAEARRTPIETILSGPAASIVGASYLTGLRDAMVSDIGGTTTDIGLLKDGRPRINPEGATVGGHSTFVEAVAMQTFGLGADSDVRFVREGTDGLVLGPRRVVPVSLLASTYRSAVHQALNRQLAAPVPNEQAGRFAVLTGAAVGTAGASDILKRLDDGPCPLDTLLTSYRQRADFGRLVDAGSILVSAFSPSDAAHVLGLHQGWDRDAACKAATLLARQRGAGGKLLADSPEAMSRLVVDLLIRTSAERLFDVALHEDGFGLDRPSRHPLLQAALSRRTGLAAIAARITLPVIGLGASAKTYYPQIGRMLSADVVVPDHADVANAIGAVVGRVRVEAVVSVTRPDDGRFRIQGSGLPRDFFDEEDALRHAAETAEALARDKAAANGAPHAEIRLTREVVSAKVADREMILEWRFSAVATGRPKF